MNAYRIAPSDANLYCSGCIRLHLSEKQQLVVHEFLVIRREALLCRSCAHCGSALLREPSAEEPKTWRKKYDEDVAAGRRFPNEELPL